MPLTNGTVYERPAPNWGRFALVYLCGENAYGMLNLGGHRDGPHLTAPIFQSDETGKWMFTAEEIKKKVKGCSVIRARLDIVESE